MTIQLLRELEKGTYDTAFLLSFTVNLSFFERLVLRRLQRTGVTDVALIVDDGALHETFAHPFVPEECGRSYVVAPINLPHGIHHAKVVWLSGRSETVAWVGSHNLTMAGFNDHAEFTYRLTSEVPGHRQALADLHALIGQLLASSEVSAAREMWARTAPPKVDAAASVWLIHNLTQPLLPQFEDHIQNATALRIVTPFLGVETLVHLTRSSGVDNVTLDIPESGLDIPLSLVVDALPHAVIRAQAPASPGMASRQLHAKVYEFHTDDGYWLAVGSANCTAKALESVARATGNLEILVLARGEEPLAGGPEFHDVADPRAVGGTGALPEGDLSARRHLRIIEAVYATNTLYVRWEAAAGTNAADVVVDVAGEWYAVAGPDVRLVVPSAPRSVTLTGLIDGEWEYAYAWVICPDELAKQRHVARRRRLEDLLGSRDPMFLANGMGSLVHSLVSFLDRPDDGLSSNAPNRSIPSLAEAPTDVRELREIFEFSPDPGTEARAIQRLVNHPAAQYPLVLLRTILTRLLAQRLYPQPSASGTDGEEDDADVAYLTEQIERNDDAQAVAVTVFTDACALLLRDQHRWKDLSPETGSRVLRVLFACGAILWLRGHVSLCRIAIQQRFRATFQDLVVSASLHPIGHTWVSPVSVLGPLAWALVAIIEAANNDPAVAADVQRVVNPRFGNDPITILKEWESDPRTRADAQLIMHAVERGDQLHLDDYRLMHLFGILPLAIKKEQERKWGYLIRLHDADRRRSPDRETLFLAAAAMGNDRPVWKAYVQQRGLGHFPIVHWVRQPVCRACHIGLAERDATLLRRGDAVVCPNCRVILLNQ